MELSKILFATLPVFLMVMVGFFTRRSGIINDDSEKSLMSLVVNVLYPCFIFSKVPGNQSLQDPALVLIAVSVGFGLTLLAIGGSYLVGSGLKIRPEDGLNTFCVSTAIQNYGFLPIPLIIALFPDSADETLGVLFVHNLGLEIALWTICIVMLSGQLSGAWKRLLNGPTIAIGLGLLMNFTGTHRWIPDFVNRVFMDMGVCTVPISLILVGATLAGVMARERWRTNWRVIGGSLMVRFVLMPPVFLLVAHLVSFSAELQRLLVIESAMPAAIFPVVLAKHFGGKPAVAVQVTIATSLVSMALTPLLISVGMSWLGVVD